MRPNQYYVKRLVGLPGVALLSFAAFASVLALPAVARAAGPEPLTQLPPADGPPALAPTRPEPPVVVFAPPPPQPAPPEPADWHPPRRESALVDGGFEVALGTLFFKPSIGETYFNGEGTPLNGNARETFHHKGRELGLASPLLWGGELSVHYLRRYFAGGVLMFVAGHPGAADTEPVPAGIASSQVNQGSLFAYGGALDFAAAIPFGMIALRPSLAFGIRGFSMPMTGYEKKTCHGKGGAYPCYEQATSDVQLFIEPRARLVITPPHTTIMFGAYVGMEPVGGTGPTAGLFFGFSSRPHEGLLP